MRPEDSGFRHSSWRMSGLVFELLGAQCPTRGPRDRSLSRWARIDQRNPRASSGTLGELGGFTSDDAAEAPIDRKVDHRKVGRRQPIAVFPFCQAMPADTG